MKSERYTVVGNHENETIITDTDSRVIVLNACKCGKAVAYDAATRLVCCADRMRDKRHMDGCDVYFKLPKAASDPDNEDAISPGMQELVAAFDGAAQSHGWEADMGNGKSVDDAAEWHGEAKRKLEKENALLRMAAEMSLDALEEEFPDRMPGSTYHAEDARIDALRRALGREK